MQYMSSELIMMREREKEREEFLLILKFEKRQFE
jgi:hypothetical protein